MRTLMTNWPNQRYSTDLFEEMDRMLSNFASATPLSAAAGAFRPAAEVEEHADHYLLSFDLPGMKKEDIKIEMKDKVLSITGERKQESKKDAKNSQIFERQYGSFFRSFTLPTAITEEKVEAHYENGVLSLYLPKTPAVQAKTIEINSSKQGGFFAKLLGDKATSNPSH